jgi:guanylate kinase
MAGKLLIFSAPSGSGKSTIIGQLMGHAELNLHFSISATSRPPRGTEVNGVEYFFISPEDFRAKIKEGDFLEYCEVYKDRFYGTLKSQVDTQIAKGHNVVFDVDVIGGCNIKQVYGERALSLFIQPPSIEELRHRLEGRGTDSPEVINDRIARAEYELTFAGKYDEIIVNDNLDAAVKKTYDIVSHFINLP